MQTHFDVIIVGAGISGISAAYYLQEQCPDKSFAMLEGRGSIGGTWDLFKYPGIRSDSDMYTLGFAFRPWTSRKAIADGEDIMTYLHETKEELGLEDKIKFHHMVKSAQWSSEQSTWTLGVSIAGQEEVQYYTCNFLSMCSGYYDYEQGYLPDYKGKDDYKGTFIHPQFWPEDLDYADKKIIVIGSGATAVTLVPQLAKKAEKVTLLQRSPTYIATAPSVDKIALWTKRILPDGIAYNVSRCRKILVQRFSYAIARKYPNFMKKLIIAGVKKELGDDYDLRHFTPRYNPWDQRFCIVPDSDLFESIRTGKSEMVTDHIDSFTSSGIELESGDHLEADIIVSATGLQLKYLAGVEFQVDGKEIKGPDLVAYKSMMFSGVPNMALAFGYTNASWTLKCDLTNRYFAKMIKYMTKKGYKKAVPMVQDPDMELLPFLDFSSGYVQRFIDQMPKSGTKAPWKLKQNYIFDRVTINMSKIDDGVMQFS